MSYLHGILFSIQHAKSFTFTNSLSVLLDPKLEPVCTVAWICMCRNNPLGLHILKTAPDSCITKYRGLCVCGMTKQAPNISPTNEKKRKLDLVSQSSRLLLEVSHCLVWVEEGKSSHLKRVEIFLLLRALHEKCLRVEIAESKFHTTVEHFV